MPPMRRRKPKWAMEWKRLQLFFGKTRTFGDRSYLLWEGVATKEGAERTAEGLRQVGMLARVTSESHDDKPIYLIWACKK